MYVCMYPYVKPNTKTKYVSTSSNHPKIVIDRIKEGVCKRLSDNSSNINMFQEHSRHFKDALEEAGHSGDMIYMSREERPEGNPRCRKVIYFNPPWCESVRTKIGGQFLRLVRKHFPKGSPLYHLFNEKKLKVSYSTAPNMLQLIKAHNMKVIQRAEGKDNQVEFGFCSPRSNINSLSAVFCS